jgi:fatty acid desaturase
MLWFLLGEAVWVAALGFAAFWIATTVYGGNAPWFVGLGLMLLFIVGLVLLMSRTVSKPYSELQAARRLRRQQKPSAESHDSPDPPIV